MAYDAADSQPGSNSFEFDVTFAVSSLVVSRPLIQLSAPSSGTLPVAMSTAMPNPNPGIYATLYNTTWSASGASTNGHQSTLSPQPSILVTPSSGQRAAGAGTSINGIPQAYGSTYSYINASNPSVARDGTGDFLVTWSEQDYLTDPSTADWNVWAEWYHADGTSLGGPFQVNTSSVKTQRYSTVAMDAQGDFAITWQSQDQDGSGYGIYAQRYNFTGTQILPIGGTSPVNVLSFTGSPTGATFTLSWNGQTTAPLTFVSGGPVSYTTSFAATVQTELQTAVHKLNPTLNVTVTPLDSNDFEIQFIGTQGAIGINVTSGTATVSTRLMGGEFQVNDTTANNQVFPAIAMDPSGAFVITWTSFGQGSVASNISNVYAKQFISNSDLLAANQSSASESASQPEIPVNTTTAATIGGDREWSSVAMDDVGDFVVTWTSYGQDGAGNGPGAGVNGQNGVYARRFNANGASPSTDPSEFLVNTFTAGNQQYSKVAMDAAGDFTITWESFQDPKSTQADSSSTPTSYGIYAQRYLRTSLIGNVNYASGPNGEYESEFNVNTTQAGDQRYPGIAMDDNGDLVVVWSGSGVDATTGTADSQGVFLQRFDLPTDTAGPRVIVTSDAADGSPIEESETLTHTVAAIAVTFSETMDAISDSAADKQNPLWSQLWAHSVRNPANWALAAMAASSPAAWFR